MPNYCVIMEDGSWCIACGNCGKALCREHSNELCNDCGNCEYGGVTLD